LVVGGGGGCACECAPFRVVVCAGLINSVGWGTRKAGGMRVGTREGRPFVVVVVVEGVVGRESGTDGYTRGSGTGVRSMCGMTLVGVVGGVGSV